MNWAIKTSGLNENNCSR